MDRSAVEDWVKRYVKAWNSNDREDITSLFTKDALYYTEPYAPPWRGHAQIVEKWLDNKDEPGTTRFEYEVVALESDLGIVRGVTHYEDESPRDYVNMWEITLGDVGRCSRFVEWWMLVKPTPGDAA